MYKDKVTLQRWEIAQESEKIYWKGFTTDSLIKHSRERYKKKAKILLKEWSKFIKIDKNSRILQIGCGPEDIINYFSIGKRYSIDPLAEFYKKKFDFDYNDLHFQKGVGEKIPFPDNYFDIVILENVLDHTHSSSKVLSEVNRVLKKKGIFHFGNYFYQKRFIQLAKVWGGIKKIFTGEIFNIHHPHMFTSMDLKQIISKTFLVIHEEIGRDIEIVNNIEELKKKKRKSKKLTVRIPAFFGLYGIIKYTSICKKYSKNS